MNSANRDLIVAYRLSAALAVLLLLASAVGLFVPSVYRDPREWADQARGINLVDLVVTPNHKFLTVDRRKSSKSGAIFRTAEEVYNLANVAIPKLKSAAKMNHTPSSVSLLPRASCRRAALPMSRPSAARSARIWPSGLPTMARSVPSSATRPTIIS